MLSLLKTFFNRSFLALFCTQYLGAFNDNFFRTAMATFITYKVADMSAGSKSVVVSLAVALFMLPFFLFSAVAGEMADKLRKDVLIKATKGLEVLIDKGKMLWFVIPLALMFMANFYIGWMTAFFSVLYFLYYFLFIRREKEAGLF